MNDSYNDLKEYLLYIKYRESKHLEDLRNTGQLESHTLNLHQYMIDKYPEMIAKIYTKEEIEQGPGGM